MNTTAITRKILLPLLLHLTFSSATSAQTRATELKVFNLRSLQCVAAQDSLLVTYTNRKNEYTDTKMVWILPTGVIRDLDSYGIKDKAISAVRNIGDSTYLYYFEVNGKNLMLGFVTLSKLNSRKKYSPKKIKIDGKLVGISGDKDLVLLTQSDKNLSLTYTLIRQDQIIDKKNLELPRKFLSSSLAFVDGDQDMSSTQAVSPVKVYYFADVIKLSIDSPNENTSSSLIWYLDTGKTETHDVVQTQRRPTKTVLLDDKFFGVASKKDLQIAIIDSKTSQVIHSSTIEQTSPISSDLAYTRNDLYYAVRQNATVWSTIDNKASECFITASQVSDSTYILKVGTHETHLRTGFFPVVSAFGPLIQLGMLATRTAIAASQGEASVDLYFYLKWDGHNLTYTSTPETISQVIDKYETEGEMKDVKLKYKEYIYGTRYAYGIYHIKNQDNHTIKIVRFDKTK